MNVTPTASSSYNEQYASTVEKLAGKPYSQDIDKGNGPNAYDCSGTVCYGIRTIEPSFGDYNADGLFKSNFMTTSTNTRGSLIFYDYESDGKIDHVTTRLGNSMILHPSSQHGVIEIRKDSYLKIGSRYFNQKVSA